MLYVLSLYITSFLVEVNKYHSNKCLFTVTSSWVWSLSPLALVSVEHLTFPCSKFNPHILHHFSTSLFYKLIVFQTVVVVYPLPWPLLVGGVRCSRLWSTSQLLRPSGQQCSHSGGVCPQIQGRQCGAYVGAVEEMMCVVCVDVTEGA